jgi:two-component system nitrogen regulation sensor histidine kinase NtrY
MPEDRTSKAVTHPRAVDPEPPEPRPERPLPPAERRQRMREFWIGVVVAAMLGALLLLPPIAGLTQGVGDSGLFLLLNAFTVMLILLLGFLIARNFWKLVGERRAGILGSHLDLKFAVSFLLTALVTTGGFFAISAFFMTQSIDKWFSVKVDRALEQSGDVAEAYYESTARGALRFAEQIAAGIAKERLPLDGEGEIANGDELVSSINPEIPAMNFVRHDSDLVRAGLVGDATWQAEEVGSGEVIRAVVPIVSAAHPTAPLGAVVVNSFIAFPQARKLTSIRSTLAEYRALQPTAGHIRSAYQLELLLAFLVILMLATWMGLRLAKSVSGPIRALAEGTAEIARGNLDIVIERSSDDEVGFLVQSFNRMTHDLRDARTRIERSNAELERRRRFLETVIGTIGAGVVSLDADGRIHSINPAAERYLDVESGSAVIGEKIGDVSRRPELRELLVRMSQPGVRNRFRRQIEIPIGDDVTTLLVTLETLTGESGERLGSVLVFDDYTQLVKVQRMEAWREVARRIAHEIKNPLTPIQLSAQRIRRRLRGRIADDADDVRVLDECVDSISDHVGSLKLLVDEFSNFARLPAADPKPDDLNRIVADTVASYAGTPGVEFETEMDPKLPMIEVDRDQIRRALTNLIDNAVAAVSGGGSSARRGGHVTLRTIHDADLASVRLEVQDDGPGIRRRDRPRIFEPYFSTKRQGTGLGLAIVSRIVADHRGYVRVRDGDPAGTRFVLELPVSAGR